jgi:ATP-dependent Clp protease ATP-binding subunit ClpA
MKKADITLMSADLKRVVLLAGDEAASQHHSSLNHEHFLLAILMTHDAETLEWLLQAQIDPGVLEDTLRKGLSAWHDKKRDLETTDEHSDLNLPFSKEMASIFTDELSGTRNRLTSPLDILIRMLQEPTKSIERALEVSRRETRGGSDGIVA